MTLDELEAALVRSPAQTEAGQRIASERIFFRCRELDGPYELRKGHRSVFQGKLRRGARCLDAAACEQGRPAGGISGEIIAYRCEQKPTPDLYQFSARHKGLRGIFRRNAMCVIVRSFWTRARA